MEYRELMEIAFKAQKKAYAPYSHFMVGAALLTKSGKVYEGCNVEEASLNGGTCAERNAIFRAVLEGEREFAAVAVAGKSEADQEYPVCTPCGVCRQALREFCDPDTFEIIVGTSPEDFQVDTLGELLPHSFGPERIRAVEKKG